MKYLICILLFGIGLKSLSQSFLPNQHDTLTEKKQEFILSGTADYASTSLHKSLTQKLFYGGEITNEIKDKSQKLHNGINQFGSDLNTELEYRNYTISLFKNQNWGFVVKSGYYSFINALYSKDLFNLTFYGNQTYIGDTAFISGTKFSNYNFQKMGFGWLDKKSKSSISLNLFNLSNYSEAFIRRGELFQSQSIDSISVAFDGMASFTSGSTFIKGIGLGLDADLRFSVPTKNGKPMFYQFIAKNIGFTSMRESLTRFVGDTVFSFTGLTFNEVLNGSSFLDSNFSILDTLGVEKTKVKTTVLLPGFFQFSKLVDTKSDRKLQEFYGVRLFLVSAYNPMIFAGLDYRFSLGKNSILNIGINSSYGGFSRFRCGTYSSLKIKKWSVGIASENILGKTGQSILFRIQCAY